MKVVSLFDGISCLRQALGEIEVEYHAFEIDEYAVNISKKNFPDIIHHSDVRELKEPILNVDLLCGGSPCQDLSIARKDRKGLDGERSGLFWEYVRILRLLKPKYFILENVASMTKENKDTITRELGVEPIMINAALVSAQNRKRFFWTNISNVKQPEDRKIYLKDVLENVVDKSYILTKTLKTEHKSKDKPIQVGHVGKTNSQYNRVYSYEGKSPCLCTSIQYYQTETNIRKLTPVECERLQSLPDNYTEGIPKTQRYKCLGNGFNVEVIKHILSNLHLREEWFESHHSLKFGYCSIMVFRCHLT